MNFDCMNNDLIRFLEIIRGPHVQTADVLVALELLCEKYFFSEAVIYELDYSSLLSVKEVYSRTGFEQNNHLFTDKLTIKEQMDISTKGYQFTSVTT